MVCKWIIWLICRNMKPWLDVEPLQKMPVAQLMDIPALPAMATWVNLRELGAKGDGETDDTKVIQEAINKYDNIYVPQGWYRITETLKMKPDTKLIGFHPFGTQFRLNESTPAFSGFGSPKAMVESSVGGTEYAGWHRYKYRWI